MAYDLSMFNGILMLDRHQALSAYRKLVQCRYECHAVNILLLKLKKLATHIQAYFFHDKISFVGSQNRNI